MNNQHPSFRNTISQSDKTKIFEGIIFIKLSGKFVLTPESWLLSWDLLYGEYIGINA